MAVVWAAHQRIISGYRYGIAKQVPGTPQHCLPHPELTRVDRRWHPDDQAAQEHQDREDEALHHHGYPQLTNP